MRIACILGSLLALMPACAEEGDGDSITEPKRNTVSADAA
jgi:hypothetical protein